MVLAVASNKRRRLDSLTSGSDDDDDDVDTSRSPSPAAGAQAIAQMISSQRHPYHQAAVSIIPDQTAMDESFDASMPSSSTKHQCDICSKTFARHEHMLRHRASHTDTASFVCQDCGKRFRRSDVLQRHRRLHIARKELSLNANNTKLTKRQRSALARVEAACLRCSSKKLKCDAEKPACSRCLRKPGVTCVYPNSSEPSPSSSRTRNRSTSVIDDAWSLEPQQAGFSTTTTNNASPIPSSTPYPAQSQALSPAGFSAGGSSVGSAAPLANMAPPHEFHPYRSENSMHQSQFSSSIPASLLPASSHFPVPGTSGTPRPYPDPNSLPTPATNAHVMGASPSFVQMLQAPVPPLNAASVHDDRTIADLLGWLDGPKPLPTVEPGQIDWIFGDSPEAPQLLDWNQMHEWANFDLAARAAGSMVMDAVQPSPAFHDPQQHLVASQHQRHGSVGEPIQQPSPLFMLSSAAEMIDYTQRTPQTKSQQPLSAGTDAPTPSVNSPRPGTSKQAVGTTTEGGRTITGGRSRWNSPELADDELVTSDSAKSDPFDGKRDAETTHNDEDAPDVSLRVRRTGKSSSGRRAAAMQAWPNRWNPALQENQLPAFSFTRASEEHLMSEDMAHVKRVSHAAMVRMAEHLKNAAATPMEVERFEASFATLDASTLNVYLQLFFHHCYSSLPAIHQVTFHPDRCDPRLLAAMCAVGAFFSEVPGSRNAAIYLASLTQMSVSRATLSNNAMARVTSTFQSILLIYMVWRSVGVPSRQEYAEAFRATYCTMIRRCRLLENISPPKLPADATIDDRWMAWVAWESGRRTAWSTLVSETELSVHWNLPEPFAPDELTGKLPCDDRLWEAPTAIEWAQTAKALSPVHAGLSAESDSMPILITSDADADFVWPDNSDQLDVHRACDIIQRTAQSLPPGHPSSVTEQEREALARLSPFSRLCVGSAVMLSTHHTMKMVRFCSMLLGDEEQARERMRTYLAAATDLLSTNEARDARVDLLLHAIQLFELVSPETLQVLSCRRGVQRMHAARRQLGMELNDIKPWKTASIVFHAGQMLRLAKQSLQRAPVECLHIFYAAIALQAVSLLVLQQDKDAPPGQIVRIAFNGPARSAAPQASNSSLEAGQTRLWRANSSTSIASSTSPSSVSGTYSTAATSVTGNSASDGRTAGKTTFMLESVGNLAHPMAPERVLSLASKWLRADDGVGVWPIGQSLAKILDSLATLTPRPAETA